MAHQSPARQRGIGFISLLFYGAVFACLGVVLAQAFPTVVEFIAVQRAVDTARQTDSITDARTAFDKQADINDIKSISGKDLVITRVNEKNNISFAYQREIHLVGPAYLTLKYTGQTK